MRVGGAGEEKRWPLRREEGWGQREEEAGLRGEEGWSLRRKAECEA